MCQCTRCEKMFEEYDLMWVEPPSQYDIQIIWTGRGQDEPKEEKMELICDKCLEKDQSTSSCPSSSSNAYDD